MTLFLFQIRVSDLRRNGICFGHLRVCFVPAFGIIFLCIMYCIAGKRNDKKILSTPFKKCLLQAIYAKPTFAFFRHYEPGTYRCLVCGVRLFSSDTKYESGSGWPSFFDAIDGKRRLVTRADTSGGSKSVVVGVSFFGRHLWICCWFCCWRVVCNGVGRFRKQFFVLFLFIYL